MYKLESVVADGGELIIHAPHLSAISATHGKLIEEIGYHMRDYFLAQWEKFRRYPWAGAGPLHAPSRRGHDGRRGRKTPHPRHAGHGHPEVLCRKVNLGYRDRRMIDPRQWQGRADCLYVPRAGEMLYKLKER